MTSTEPLPDYWEAVTVDSLENYPDSITRDDGPFLFENTNTSRRIWLEPNDSLEEFDAWLVTGENSIVDSADSFDEAKTIAYEFMHEYSHPSAMI